MSVVNTNFEEVVLNRSELRMLRKASKGKVPLSKCKTLMERGFVDEEKVCNPGYMPVATGFAEINPTGAAFLSYIMRRNREHKITRWISVIALVISMLSLLLQALTQLVK